MEKYAVVISPEAEADMENLYRIRRDVQPCGFVAKSIFSRKRELFKK